MARRHVAPPYTPAELRGLRRAACQQSTLALRRAATALVALGAGLAWTGGGAPESRPPNPHRGRHAWWCRWGSRQLVVVPVLADFGDDLVALAATPTGRFLVGGDSLARNRASALAARVEMPAGVPRLSAARLRSTWLVHHLAAGTRLPELVAAAGLAGATVLSDLLPYVDPLPDEAARQLLARPSGASPRRLLGWPPDADGRARGRAPDRSPLPEWSTA